ncbi:helix-turn-helix transcriptional regulator [Streptomyces chryseus]|uniref:Helix-turn-helix transcriptional regulator n=1 Tax=Streptomyces chryseus TaxID=68186 RepID=A0ABQ3DM71_9ACTN|nr:LuxR family transcriptional regulator [Streptomyces chryseus]GHB02247.1 helix-turn-helix transcriptional regulator [Streptomyces chryseus]
MSGAVRLYGRRTELEAVAALSDRVRSGRGGALLIAAEPGLGRTALLRRAAADFDAGPVLHTRAVPAESRLPYSALHALLCAAGGAGPAGAPRSGLAPGALLELLRTRAAGRPLLVCVDDAHLCDDRSRAALGFAARRPDAMSAVGLLLTSAAHRAHDPDFAGLPVVRPGPLPEHTAGELLDELVGNGADPAVRQALLHEAEGNPALLKALLGRLSPAQLSGHAPLPRPLADGDALLGTVGDRLAVLPPDTAFVLLLAAAAQEQTPATGGADTALVARAARAAGIGTWALDAGRWAGVARCDGDLIRFANPLLRRAVLAGAPTARRRAAHHLLATVLTGDRHRLPRLLHRALAAEAPDPRLAAGLAAAASAPGVCGLQRSLALARAAEHTPADDAARTSRLTAAAELARLAGQPHRARELLAAARAGGRVHDAVRGRAELAAGVLGLGDGPVGDAQAALLVAAGLLGPYDPRHALTARLAAMEAAWAAGDAAGCVAALGGAGPAPAGPATYTTGQGVCPHAPPGRAQPYGASYDDYRSGMLAALCARPAAARKPLRRVLERAVDDDDPQRLLRAGSAALVLGDIAAAIRITARGLALGRARDLVALVPQLLEHLAYAELRAGRHARAGAHAREGLTAGHRAGRRNTLAHLHAVLALVASVESDAAAVAGHVGAAMAIAGPHGLAQAATLAEWASARADLGRGRAAEAAARLGPLVREGPRRGHFAVRMLAVPCFVEATALAGRPDDAPAVVEEFAAWAAHGGDPQAPALLARCRALLACPDEADALYAHALALHASAGGDFEWARTQLLYGKWLRRRRRPGEARGRLRDALVAFERSEALAWVDQARAELRATGDVAAGEPAGALSCLTPQQLRIAHCVAEGATNREVAQRLSVSHRTVDHHLRNVFAQLGVRSRVELSRLVERAGRTG